MLNTLHVHYGQAYVESGGEHPDADMEQNFRGQPQGLCGARIPGALFLITGLHTGTVGFEVRIHGDEPPVDETFEDIVEVSFRPATQDVQLTEWAAQATYPLAIEHRDYRVRYSARGMDAAHEQDTVVDGEPIIDSYLLEFWPAAPAAQRIVKQTSANAAYWHDYARGLGPA
ncbi:MAG TPA: hypothetical protein VN947_10795 [Polyangia bacterium]|nr:hypothetical protein [Polyangia bacterium]